MIYAMSTILEMWLMITTMEIKYSAIIKLMQRNDLWKHDYWPLTDVSG